MSLKVSNRDYEQISAYLDGQLPSGELRRFEERLRKQPDLKEALNEMSRTRALLRQAPRRRAPRNFTLTPAMVADMQPRRKRGFSLNLFPALSFASALAAVALVATLVFQLLPGQPARMTTGAAPEAQPAAAQPALATSAAASAPTGTAPSVAAQAAPSTQGLQAQPGAASKAATDQAAPPVIVWSGPGYGGAATGMGGGGGGPGGVPYLGQLLGPPSFQNAAPVYGMGGGGGPGGGVTGPAVILPPDAARGLQSAAPTQNAAPTQAAVAAAPVTGSGPILGVPAKDQGGQVIEEKSIQGFPSGPTGIQRPAAPDTSTAAVPASTEPTLFGLPRLTFIEILLGAIAVLTGAAALILRRMANK